jgi:hypothetical protein
MDRDIVRPIVQMFNKFYLKHKKMVDEALSARDKMSITSIFGSAESTSEKKLLAKWLTHLGTLKNTGFCANLMFASRKCWRKRSKIVQKVAIFFHIFSQMF